MDIGRSFTYVIEDEEWWKKVLIGAALSLIPFIGQFYMMGYVLAAMKNVIAGRDVPLPEPLDDFGDKLVKGLLLAVITFIFFLPVTIVGACSSISPLFEDMIADPDAVRIVIPVWLGCFGCLSIILSIATALLLPFVWGKYAETGQFGEAFKLGEIFGMLKSNIGPAFVVLLVSAVANALASLGLIVCLIGMVFTVFYAQLVVAFLYGSLYRQAKQAVL